MDNGEGRVSEVNRAYGDLLIAITNSVSDGLILLSDEGRVVIWNPAAERIFGYSSREVRGKEIYEFIVPPADRGKYKKGVQLFRETGGGNFINATHEWEARRKNGAKVVVEITISSTFLENHSHLLVTVRDISEQRKKEKRLEKDREYARYLIDSSFDMIVAVDKDRRVVEFNRSAQKTFGYARDEVIGKKINMLYADQSQAKIPRDILRKKGDFTREVFNRRKDGTIFQSLVSASLIRDSHGEAIGTMGISRDITELKRQEEELRGAKEKAEAASKAKDKFFANMTHEIRTPLNAVIGMTDLGLETGSPEEMKQYLTIAKESADFLLILLNTVLDYSKIEAGKLELDEMEFDLADAVETTIGTLSAQAHGKGVELLWRKDTDVPDFLIGDSPRLKQVLVNLIGNAIKFTETGEIVLDVRLNEQGRPDKTGKEAQEKERIELLFSLRDTGIGIPADKIDRIFTGFVQVDSSTTRKYGGTGLGLTIVKRVVELMGGHIWVESEPLKGSVFYFTVTFGGCDKKREINGELTLTGKKSLIIDSNKTNRLIVRKMLEQWGLTVHESENGGSGLTKLRRAKESGEPYHLIIFDSRMSDVPGFQIAEIIREDPSLVDHSLIMLYSNHRGGDFDRVRELGMTGYILKPIRQKTLRSLVMKAFDIPGGELLDGAPDPENPDLAPDREKPLETVYQTPIKLGDDNKILTLPDTANEPLFPKRLSFVKKIPEHLKLIEASIRMEDLSGVERHAKKLHDEALDIGAALVKKETFRIVLAARRDDLRRCSVLYKWLEEEMGETRRAIESYPVPP